MMKQRPVIAVTGPKKGGTLAWLMTALALKRAGAVPVRVCDIRGLDMTMFKGVILGGGSDIYPESYGEERQVVRPDKVSGLRRLIRLMIKAGVPIHVSQPDVDLERDTLERDMFGYAFDHGMPVLGICRGLQLINTALGGSLFQDIRGFYTVSPYRRTVLPRKRITVDPPSRLCRILHTEACAVNALHIQAVKVLGSGLAVTARDQNNVVQAIEHRDHPFMIGVQWHPEYLPYRSVHQRLFRALVDSAGNFEAPCC